MNIADQLRRYRIKFFNWEYWPFWLLYIPVFFYWGWLQIRARSWFFFGTANPGIRYSGFLMESKKEIYDLIPNEYYPRTLFFKAGSILETCLKGMEENGLQFPVIAKPDIGLKGKMVSILNSKEELMAYLQNIRVDLLLQELIRYPNEIGLFYYRMPGEKKGKITGIVRKEFLSVTGDGESTLEALVRKDDRAFLQLEALAIDAGTDLKMIPAKGENILLVPYGNHCRGALFLDHSHLVTTTLEDSINHICTRIPGFYYGRLDLRYNDWNELCEGKNLQIVELNGAGSEPTHIYDPSHSVFFAWKEIIRHLNILYRISMANRRLNHPSLGFMEGCRMMLANKKQMRLLKTMQA